MSRVTEHARGLERGRDCYARRAWAEAYEALHAADQSSQLGVDDLERISWSAALTGRDDALLGLLERLHQAHLEAGNTTPAAHAAFWLGFRLLSMGEMGRASGWLARAQRLVEQEKSDCVVRGYLMLPVVYRKLGSADYDAAYATAREAAEIGERCRDRDLTSFARHLQGRVLLEKGQLDEGLALLDEAMVAVTTGELSTIICGFLYCGMIASCQKVYALGRAREWTAALARWCESQPQLVTFTGSCMIHRSQILQLGGDWSEAIAEAHRAAERYSGSSDQEVVAEAMYQQAEIHRLRGEFEAAEEAYRRASQLGRDAQPGLALLRLAQKRNEPSAAAIRRVVEAATQRMERARLLPAYVEIMLAVGDVDAARLAAAELEEIAAGFGMEGLTAIARHARGAVQLAGGDARAALESFRRAFAVWQRLGAPYFAARLRVQVGCACRALGDDDGAALELDAAREAFERLGARPDVVRVDSLKKNAEGARRHGLTSREVEVLRLVASGKTNKAIAEELGLSEKTVDRHVSNIFTKLDVSSRAAATAHAYEHALI